MESFVAAAETRALDCGNIRIGTRVELDCVKAELNGKRGRVVQLDSSTSQAVVSLSFVREAGEVDVVHTCVRALNLRSVSETPQPATSISSISRRHDDASNVNRVCFIECCIADVTFTERLDHQRNPGWFRLPLEGFIKGIFEAVITRGKVRPSEARRKVRQSQMFCGRLRIDNAHIPWTASMELLAGEALYDGRSADRPHRIEVHIDLCAPRRAQSVVMSAAAALASADRVRVVETEGKGSGLFAVRDLFAGEEVLVEAVLARLPYRYSMDQLSSCIGSLTATETALFFSLSANTSKFGRLKEVYSVWMTNALPLSSGATVGAAEGAAVVFAAAEEVREAAEEEAREAARQEARDGRAVASTASEALSVAWRPTASEEAGIFPTLARANHSCMPCARYEWDAAGGQMRLIAMDEIPAGGEVTISYGLSFSLDPRVSHVRREEPSAERRRRLQEHFGFTCRCARCLEERSELGEAVDEEAADGSSSGSTSTDEDDSASDDEEVAESNSGESDSDESDESDACEGSGKDESTQGCRTTFHRARSSVY